MDDVATTTLEGIGYWPRVTRYDGAAIEHALAPPSLIQEPPSVSGAVIEAAYAATGPPVLDRLREDAVPYVVDPQAFRFISPSYMDIHALASLPYAPEVPIEPEQDLTAFVRKALSFQSSVGASCYVAPGFPASARETELLNLAVEGNTVAAQLNGTEIPRRPLVAFVAPDLTALKSPKVALDPLKDLAIDAVYVQPTALKPTFDSVEKLVQYVRFLLTATELDLPVIAGRLGAFGLVLEGLGAADFFDSGLGEAESFNLSALNRVRRKRNGQSAGGGRRRLVYLPQLMTTLENTGVEVIQSRPELLARFFCGLPCCRWRGAEGLAERRRLHYINTRLREIDGLSSLPPGPMRLEHVHRQLQQARDEARHVHRVLRGTGAAIPSFDHLDRWLAVLARIAGVPAAA